MKKLLISICIISLFLVSCGVSVAGTNLEPRPKSLDKLAINVIGGNDLGYTSSIKVDIVSDRNSSENTSVYDIQARYGEGLSASYEGYMAYVGDEVVIEVIPSDAHNFESLSFNGSYYSLENGVARVPIKERDALIFKGNYITIQFSIKDSYADKPVIINDNIYEVTTARELRWVAVASQRGDKFTDKTIRLMNDIDMQNIEFTGISTGLFSGTFAGTFDGGRYEVKNLKINLAHSYVGLIGKLSSLGTIKDLSISGSIISEGDYVGGIVGFSRGSIENVINKATVKGSYYVAGIAGINRGVVNNSTNVANIAGEEYVSGIAGVSYGNVVNPNNSGNVTGYKYVSQIAHYYPKECTISGNIVTNGTDTKGVHVKFDK